MVLYPTLNMREPGRNLTSARVQFDPSNHERIITMLLPEDKDGYAIPWAGDDAVIECAACDPLGGQPDDWPECEWIDGNRYALGPDPDPDEPAEEDIMKFLARCHERERNCWEDIPTGGCFGHHAVEPGID